MSEAISTADIRERIKRCGDPSAMIAAGDLMMTSCTNVSSQGEALVSRWRRLNGCYFAPETGQLVASMTPVREKTERVGTGVAQVGRALTDFGSTALDLKPKFERLLQRAIAFNAKAAANPDWRGNSSSVAPAEGKYRANRPTMHDNAAMHHEYSDIMQQLEVCQRQLLQAEGDCVSAISRNTDKDLAAAALPPLPVHQPGQLGSEMPGAGMPLLTWEDDLALGHSPFGKTWLDHAPLGAKITTGFEKSFADLFGGLTRLGGLDFNWDPATGKSHWDFGAHVLGPAWRGMAKTGLVLGFPAVALAGSGVSKLAGNVFDSKALRDFSHAINPATVLGDLGKGVTGAGLPGGWGTRAGYIAGGVVQAAIPGPGKAGIAALAEKEGIVGAMARGAQWVGKGGWVGADARWSAGKLGLGEKLGDLVRRLPGGSTLADLPGSWNVRLHGGSGAVEPSPWQRSAAAWGNDLSPDHVGAPHDRFGRAAQADQRALDRHAELSRTRDDKTAFEQGINRQVQQIVHTSNAEAADLSAAGNHAGAAAVHRSAAAEIDALQRSAQPLRDQLNEAVTGGERRAEAAGARADRAWDEYANPTRPGSKPSSLVGYAAAVDEHGNQVVVQIHHHRLDPAGPSAPEELSERLQRGGTVEHADRMTDGYRDLAGVHEAGTHPQALSGLVRRVNDRPFAVDENTVMLKVHAKDGKEVLAELDRYGHTVGGYVARDQDVSALTAAGLRDDLALTYRSDPTTFRNLRDLRDLPQWLTNDGRLQPFHNAGRDGVVLIRFRPHPDDVGLLRTPVDATRLGLKNLPAHLVDEDKGAPYLGTGRAGEDNLIPEVKSPAGSGVRIADGEVAWRHELHGRATETVFAVYRDGERMMLRKPLTYYVDDGTLVDHVVRSPEWLKQMYGESPWDTAKDVVADQFPLHASPREAWDAVRDGEQYDDQQREEQRILAQMWAHAQAAGGQPASGAARP